MALAEAKVVETMRLLQEADRMDLLNHGTAEMVLLARKASERVVVASLACSLPHKFRAVSPPVRTQSRTALQRVASMGFDSRVGGEEKQPVP
ncbi:hypothetical protein NDU88_008756 [Pleurodeles waltl]|uniref:Uncharacterized protein n=1 Tax=Pleurodeles waltl TaxID=8319 RepID=A0AAV7RU63_PLEWA|nr:hypothetical protein NDU88_008756 [Pleurodeles waltl]